MSNYILILNVWTRVSGSLNLRPAQQWESIPYLHCTGEETEALRVKGCKAELVWTSQHLSSTWSFGTLAWDDWRRSEINSHGFFFNVKVYTTLLQTPNLDTIEKKLPERKKWSSALSGNYYFSERKSTCPLMSQRKCSQIYNQNHSCYNVSAPLNFFFLVVVRDFFF